MRVHGSDFQEPAMDGHERLVFQNVQGISRGPVPALELTDAINETHASIYGVAEPNCVMCDDIITPINARLDKEYGTGVAVACSTPGTTSKSGYLPGGIMQIVKGSPTGRIHSTGRDPLGRFSWATFRGHNNNKLCTITAYHIC